MNDDSKRICVVGAGVIGMSIALRLRELSQEVLLIESGRPGKGISGAALGSLTPDSDEDASEATRALARASIEQYPAWLNRLSSLTGLQIPYDETGLLELALTKNEFELLQNKRTTLSAIGAQVEIWSRNQVLCAEPNVSNDVVGGLFYGGEPFLDVPQLLKALELALGATDCELTPEQLVIGIAPAEKGRVEVLTSVGSIVCAAVVIASGHGLESLLKTLGVRLARVRGEVVEVQGPPGHIRRHLYWGDGFITPRRDGRLLLGSTYVEETVPFDDVTTTVSVGGALSNLQATNRMVPGIASMQLLRTWKNWRARTPDGQPALGVSMIPNVYLAVGLSGLGVTLAPAVAKELGTLITGGTSRLLESLSPGRFVEKS